MLRTLRIRRLEDRVLVETLSRPDLAGNRTWVVIAEFNPDDLVLVSGTPTNGTWKKVSECSNEEIVGALKDGPTSKGGGDA